MFLRGLPYTKAYYQGAFITYLMVQNLRGCVIAKSFFPIENWRLRDFLSWVTLGRTL